jgi:hypothetical protein
MFFYILAVYKRGCAPFTIALYSSIEIFLFAFFLFPDYKFQTHVFGNLTTTAQHEPLSEWTVRDRGVYKINVNGFSSYGVGFPLSSMGLLRNWGCA